MLTKKIMTLSLLIITAFSFGQEIEKATKKIRGFVFDNQNIPIAGATINIKVSDKLTSTDINGKFEIEAKEGDILRVSSMGYSTRDSTVSDKNCYKLFLSDEAGNPYNTRKTRRFEHRAIRKAIREYKRKAKKGFYDCYD